MRLIVFLSFWTERGMLVIRFRFTMVSQGLKGAADSSCDLQIQRLNVGFADHGLTTEAAREP